MMRLVEIAGVFSDANNAVCLCLSKSVNIEFLIESLKVTGKRFGNVTLEMFEFV